MVRLVLMPAVQDICEISQSRMTEITDIDCYNHPRTQFVDSKLVSEDYILCPLWCKRILSA